MSITYQETVVSDSNYSFVNDPSNILFDIHNDSPFNVGLSFGVDTGMANADYFTPPHSILQQVPAPNTKNPQYSTKLNPSWKGTIYIYTQTPLGGAGVDVSTAPSLSVTVVAYNPTLAPGGYTSLNRMTNTGNTLPINSSSSYLQNHGDASGTKIISITDSGDPSGDTVAIDNLGNLTLGNGQHSGQLNVGGAIYGGETTPGLGFSTDTLGRVKSPRYFFGGFTLSAISFFSGTAGTTLAAFSHGLTDISGNPLTPDYIFLQKTGTSAGVTLSYDPATLTSTQAKIIASAASTGFVAIAVKQ